MVDALLEAAKIIIRKHAGVWFETFGRIWPKDRSAGLLKPNLNYLQDLLGRVIGLFEELGLPIRIIELKPRQRGSTTFSTCVGYTKLRRESTAGVIIGGEYSQTDQAWKMMQTYQNNDGFDGWGNSGKIDEEKGVWTHGSTLKKETAKDVHAGISGTFQFLLATEVARWASKGIANAAEVLSNILKCVPLGPRTCIILESTAEGEAGDFVDRWNGAVDAEDFLSGKVTVQPGQYVRVFAAWFQFADSALRLTAEQKRGIEATLDKEAWYDGERELIAAYGKTGADGVLRLGEAVADFDVWEQLAWRRWAIVEECKKDPKIFDRDYPHSWKAAFQSSGQQRFNAAGLAALRKRSAERSPSYGVLDAEESGLNPVWRTTGEDECVFVRWEEPIPGCKYLFVADTMTGESQVVGEDPDCHAPGVLRAGYWEPGPIPRWVRPALVARVKAPCRWDIDMLEPQVWKLACYYGGGFGCKMVIEMNADRGLTELLKLRGADLYEREVFNEREKRIVKQLGWLTTPGNRESLVEKVAGVVRDHDKDGAGIDVWDEHTLDELDWFVRKANGRSEAAEGYHDDHVMMLGIGLTCLPQATRCTAEYRRKDKSKDLLKHDGFRLVRQTMTRAERPG